MKKYAFVLMVYYVIDQLYQDKKMILLFIHIYYKMDHTDIINLFTEKIFSSNTNDLYDAIEIYLSNIFYEPLLQKNKQFYLELFKENFENRYMFINIKKLNFDEIDILSLFATIFVHEYEYASQYNKICYLIKQLFCNNPIRE